MALAHDEVEREAFTKLLFLSVVCGPQTSEPLQVFANSVDSSCHPTFNESEFIYNDV